MTTIATVKRDSRLVGSRWRRLWPALPAVLALAFLAYVLPPYLTFDPARSRIPPPAGIAAYYPVLVAHIVFASIAMLAASVQIWTGLRQCYPIVHRWMGRVYVFGGVLPAAIAGLAIGAMSPFGPVVRASNMLLAVAWLACTITGFRMGRQRRLEEHRRWMIRSFVLTMSIVTNRVWAVVFVVVLSPQLTTTFNGNPLLLGQAVAGLSAWLGWVIPLLVVEWWLIDSMTSNAGRARAANAVA